MKAWIAYWNILAKDMRSYYLKRPNLRWESFFRKQGRSYS